MPTKKERLRLEEEGPRATAGKPPHEPTDQNREWVRFSCAMGARQQSILAILGIDDKTFKEHYSLEWDEGKTQLGLRVSEEVVKRAFGYEHEVRKKKYKRGKPIWDRDGQQVTHLVKEVVMGDSNLLLRLFNAWVQAENKRLEHTGKDGKDLPIAPGPTTIFVPGYGKPNGRETGSNGDPAVTRARMAEALEAQAKLLRSPEGPDSVH